MAIVVVVLSGLPASAQTPPAQSGPLGGRLGLHVHGGMGIHSTGDLLDDTCSLINQAYELQGFTSTRCGGNNGGTPFTLGAYLSFTPKASGRTRFQIQGGYSFTGENDIRLETDGTYEEPDYDTTFSLVGGYRFNSHVFYGGAGVEMNRLYIGGKVGVVHHTGDEYATLRFTVDGVPYDEFDDARGKSGTSALFGVRATYAILPAVRLYADWETYGLGDYYEMFDDALPASIERSARNRVFGFGVALDVLSFFK